MFSSPEAVTSMMKLELYGTNLRIYSNMQKILAASDILGTMVTWYPGFVQAWVYATTLKMLC
jgi:hypothetical protein